MVEVPVKPQARILTPVEGILGVTPPNPVILWTVFFSKHNLVWAIDDLLPIRYSHHQKHYQKQQSAIKIKVMKCTVQLACTCRCKLNHSLLKHTTVGSRGQGRWGHCLAFAWAIADVSDFTVSHEPVLCSGEQQHMKQYHWNSTVTKPCCKLHFRRLSLTYQQCMAGFPAQDKPLIWLTSPSSDKFWIACTLHDLSHSWIYSRPWLKTFIQVLTYWLRLVVMGYYW